MEKRRSFVLKDCLSDDKGIVYDEFFLSTVDTFDFNWLNGHAARVSLGRPFSVLTRVEEILGFRTFNSRVRVYATPLAYYVDLVRNQNDLPPDIKDQMLLNTLN